MADPQDSSQIPPPPAGFQPVQSAPPPPSGFSRVSSSVPPPPAGFTPVSGSGQQQSEEKPPEQPGAFERMYEVSGIKGLVDQAKARGDQDEAVQKEVIAAVKSGKYGHAAETLLHHVARSNEDAFLGPAGQIIKNTATSTYQHGKAAVQAASQGKVGEAVENAAEAVPILGQVGESVGKPLGTDLGNKNYAGAVGDVVGGIPAV